MGTKMEWKRARIKRNETGSGATQTRASRRPRTRPSAPPRHKARPPTKEEDEEHRPRSRPRGRPRSRDGFDLPSREGGVLPRSGDPLLRDDDHQQQAMRMGGDG